MDHARRRLTMTEQTPPLADEPIPDEATDDDGSGTSGRAREWLTQLESMIQQVGTAAAPVARQVSAKAAELAALAAVKAGPAAHRAAELTTEYGQRFAEKAQTVAADLRHQDDVEGDAAAATPASAADATEPPAETEAGAITGLDDIGLETRRPR
jgi:hypothetical protein